MAEINDILEQRYPERAINTLEKDCEELDIQISAVTSSVIQTRILEFLVARRRGIRLETEKRAETTEYDPQAFYEKHASESAAQLSESITDNVITDERNRVYPGDFSVALLKLQLCRWWPFC